MLYQAKYQKSLVNFFGGPKMPVIIAHMPLPTHKQKKINRFKKIKLKNERAFTKQHYLLSSIE